MNVPGLQESPIIEIEIYLSSPSRKCWQGRAGRAKVRRGSDQHHKAKAKCSPAVSFVRLASSFLPQARAFSGAMPVAPRLHERPRRGEFWTRLNPMPPNDKPRSLPPPIKLASSVVRESGELARLGEMLEGAAPALFELLSAAAARLDISVDDAAFVVALTFLIDQVPPIGSAEQCAAYELQLGGMIAKAGDMPLAQYVRTVEGLLIAPTLVRIEEWQINLSKGAI